MILYNVTTNILPDVHDEWLHWMKTVHVPDVMSTGHFSTYRMCKLDKMEEEDDAITYVFQYTAASRNELENYFNNHASRLREDVVKKFADKFIAFRTVMELVDEG